MKTPHEVPVILMDCEHRSIEGVLSSFGKRGIEIIALTSERDNPPPAFHSKYVSHTYFSPPVRYEEAYLQFLDDLPHRGVLLFSTDSAAQFVSKFKTRLLQANYLINIPDAQTLQKGFDKDRIYDTCMECGVPTIPTKKVHTVNNIYQAASEFGFPLLLKPTRLAGSRFQKIDNPERIPEAYRKMEELIHSKEFAAQQSGIIVQEFIDYNFDDLYCVEMYYDQDQDCRELLSVQKIRPDINRDGTVGSRLFAGQTVQIPKLERYSEKLLDYLQWTGLAHLDWLYSSKYESFLLCEINPRLPGFSNFPTKIGFEMAWYYYADLIGDPVEPFRFKPALYFEALRHPGDLTSNLVAVLNGHLSFWSFLKPYFQILTHKNEVVLDVYYGDDLRLTLENYKISLRNLLKTTSKLATEKRTRSKAGSSISS